MRKLYPNNIRFDDLTVGSTLALNADVRKKALCPDVFEYEIDLSWDEASAKDPGAEVAVLFDLPCVNVQYMWHPAVGTHRVLDADWRLNIHSMLTNNAPVAMLFSGDGNNTYTYAVSEVRKETSVEFGVGKSSGDCSIAGKIAMGLYQFEGTNHTCLRIRADHRHIPCHEALDAVRAWWEQSLSIPPMKVPVTARMPMYSSWYNFAKDIDDETLVAECRLAKALGMETIIVDDGWQTAENATGYGYTGDWKVFPGKFSNMRAFVERVHALGMRVILWYSVPFMGYFSENWEKFKDFILYREDRNNTGILDPRYPEVRRFLIDLYVDALKAFDLDGFKLDFIDRFVKPAQDELKPGMDFICVQEATDHMMIEIMQSLRAIKSDILIEFRQNYIGPCMRQFGNMFRVGDCPADITSNRISIADLRMLSGSTAVHSDMITWNNNEKPEDAALQILHTLFGVTQVSKVLRDIPENHLSMLRFWLAFERNNYKLLQESQLIPYEPHHLYPVIKACDETEEILAVYADNKIVQIDPQKCRCQLVNATWQDHLTIRTQEAAQLRLEVFDCMGHAVSERELAWEAGLHELPIPRSGLAVIHPIAE